MAEGFLVRPLDGEMERVGAECFDDLLARSFFQQSSASPSSFVMHDLMHDLATHVSGQFCFSRRTPHLSLVVDTGRGFSSTKLENIREAQLLRTFRPFAFYLSCPPEIYKEIFQSTHCRLRVLFMTNCRDASMLSCSTSKLKHLRYLDLSRSGLVTLPEEVSALLNLQTLILKWCRQLARLPDLGNLKLLRHLNLEGSGIKRLPESLERLINLRYLNITGTPLKEMPPHIGQLTKLQTLTDFLVGRQSETSIKELGKLRHLRGELHIGNLQNVVDARDAVEANLKDKRHLDELRFTWDGYTHDPWDGDTHDPWVTHDPQHVTSTLEKLKPHINVKYLQIYGYGGVRFPEWVGESSFSNIVSLVLRGCRNCTSLPPLGQLASLKDLSIEAFDEVETVGSEFYGNCTAMKKPFQSLKTLSFKSMPEWCEWISDEGSQEAFPLLEWLSIKECPNLAKALPRFPRVLSLDVSQFDSLESLPEDFNQMGCSPSDLGRIEIEDCASLKCVALDLLPKLKSLYIGDCLDLESLCAHERPLNDLNSLHSLTIETCPKLVSFPKGGLPAPVLTELHLFRCSNLKQLPESMHSLLTSLRELKIKNCPLIESMPEEGLPSSLSSLVIEDCSMLKSLPRLQHLTSLRRLEISNCPLIESMPEEGLPSSLSTLEIKYCSMLKSLTRLNIHHCPLIESMPEEGLPSSLSTLEIKYCSMLKSLPRLQHLTSLTSLTIKYCPLIESLPEEGLPSSFSFLVIYNCPLLKSLPRLQHLTSLTSLTISNCPLIESMPEEGLSSSLSFLFIYNCPLLKSLPRLQHLTSLRELDISECPLIESMPEEGLPSSLSTLVIRRCPMLGESCEREKGKDWPKISHIPHIRIY